MVKVGGGWKFLLILAVVLVAVAAIYFTVFYSYTCDDAGCFRAHQEECAKTKFVNSADDATWAYQIEGKTAGKCEITVELRGLKRGDIKLQPLEGKAMTCLLPLGNTAPPEADISKCHGILKEELQAVIINNLHSYILDNVGEINEELQKAI